MGGAERVTIELALTQRREGLDAQILSLGSEQDFLVDAVKERGIPLSVSENTPNRFRRYAGILRTAKKFDVVHCHSPRALLYLSPIVPLFAGKRFIYTRHGLEPLSAAKWIFMHKVLHPFIYCVTFVTQSGCEVFKTQHKWDEAKLRVINNGVFVPENYSVSKKYPVRFGSVGRMVALKGQPILLEAVKLLAQELGESAKSRFTLKFFGGGPLESQLRDQAAAFTPGLVEFCGEQSDLEKIYQSIDVLIVASQSEGLSMVIMEAMARGRPAIATDVGGNSTLVKNFETGLLIPFGSAAQLASAMRNILNNPELIEEYGVNARELIKNDFSLVNTHRDYLKCYVD